jgi:hypothetical protein
MAFAMSIHAPSRTSPGVSGFLRPSKMVASADRNRSLGVKDQRIWVMIGQLLPTRRRGPVDCSDVANEQRVPVDRLATDAGMPLGGVVRVTEALEHVVTGTAEQDLEGGLQGRGPGPAKAAADEAQRHGRQSTGAAG